MKVMRSTKVTVILDQFAYEQRMKTKFDKKDKLESGKYSRMRIEI